MKIGLIFQDSGFRGVDLKNPEDGNPGIGGTQFCFIMLAKYLKLSYPEIDVHVFHFSENIFPVGIQSHIISSEYEAICKAKEKGIEILIIKNGINKDIVNIIEKLEVNTFIWAHNYIFSDELKLITDCKSILRVIFVGKEQYDRYIDHEIINKSIYIYNMFKSNRDKYYRNEDFDLNVTYTGSLVPSKGFHVLAKEWKNIIKKVPNAKLNIIGSGRLYDRNSRMGKYGIAEEAYESTFLSYITDDEGNLLNSINFCGVLGQEKYEIYRNTAVGVVNPTGKTETFGLSAVEMEACGIPIVTKAANGLLDTVVHNKTGLLCHTGTRLRKNIIKLLKDKNLNNSLGIQARVFVEKFEPENIIKEWMFLITESFLNQEIEFQKPINNFSNNLKWLRITNRKLNNANNKGDFPSVIDLETYVSLYIRRLKKSLS